MKTNIFSEQKRKRLLGRAFIAVTMLMILMQAYTARNYPDQNYPFYSANYALENPKPAKSLTVVSYNIWFAENIDQALLEIQKIKSQKELDIVLLQEMDEAGTEHIARELQLNYVYFPAAIEPTYDRNFGNAVLSRWPIIDSQKLILPHQSLSNRMNRIATRATIRIHGIDILVYSIHTESIFTLPQFREDQYITVLKDIDPETELVIVGGDFNSYTDGAVEKVEETYGQAGFIRASEAAGYTATKYGIKLSPDHIFVKGLAIEETGKIVDATASDHLPIWVTLARK